MTYCNLQQKEVDPANIPEHCKGCLDNVPGPDGYCKHLEPTGDALFTPEPKTFEMNLNEYDNLMDDLNTVELLNKMSRQVKWLYNNSNKLTIVYEEKFVRLLVHRLNEKIKTLENEISRYEKTKNG